MTMVRIAISLPAEQIEAAEQAVAQGRAQSVSAYISTALRESTERSSLDELLEQWERESGPIPEAVRAETDTFFAAVDARNRTT